MSEYIPEIIIGIIGLIAVVFFVILLIKSTPKQRQEIINKVLFSLATEAEKLYGSKTGQVKKAQVIAWFYERYRWLSIFISEDELSVMIDTAAAKLTEYLQSNPVGAVNILGDTVNTIN